MNVIDDQRHELDDIERRLRVACNAVIPRLLDDTESQSRPHRRRDSEINPDAVVAASARARRRSSLSVAAAVLVLVVIGAFVYVGRSRSSELSTTRAWSVPAPPSSLPATTSAPTVVVGLGVEPVPVPWPQTDAPIPPFDEIPIAPGTIVWYEVDLDALPAGLRDRLGDETRWDPDYAAGFYRCTNWQAGIGSVADGTVGPSDVTCDRLAGGYRETIEYGDTLSVGSGSGASDWTGDAATTVDTLAAGLASGSLWGYDTELPEPSEHDIDGTRAVSYRAGDHAYLVLEPTPGSFVWLHSRGLTDGDLEALAHAVRPVDAPATLPVPLVLGDDLPAASAGGAQLKLVWLDGRPCAGLQLWEECTPADHGPALVLGYAFEPDQQPSVAAITPIGSGTRLSINLFGNDTPITVGRTFSGLGLDTATFLPGEERLLSADLIGPDGTVVAATDWGIETMINGFAPDLVGEGRTEGIAWVVVRQDPAWDGPAPSANSGGGYCLLLFEASGGYAPLCSPSQPPATGLGIEAGLHDQLNLIEVADDVTTLTCHGTTLDIITDDHLDNRRFVITPCDNPTPP